MTRELHEKLLRQAAWKRLRKSIIDKGRCECCQQLHAEHRLQVHHEPPVDERTTLRQFFDRNRLVCICISCHSMITSAAPRKREGPPPTLDKQGRLTPEWIAFRKRKRRA